jgi:Wiskott-Aldrich syndrome protein
MAFSHDLTRNSNTQDFVARRAALESEISITLRPFYCELCDKQFKNVAQYDEHTNSYSHHHKARFRDMQTAQRSGLKEDVDKRKEKERKREEKELRKLAKAAGVKMVKPAATASSSTAYIPTTAAQLSADKLETPSKPKKSGWAVIAADEPSSISRTASERVAVESVATPPMENQPPPLPPSPKDGRPASDASQMPSHPSSHRHSGSHMPPSFRTAGWASLETSNAPLQNDTQSSRTQIAPSSSSSWSHISPEGSKHPLGTDSSLADALTFGAPGDTASHSSHPTVTSVKALPVLHSAVEPSLLESRATGTTSASQNKLQGTPGKSSWQQFQAKGSRRR